MRAFILALSIFLWLLLGFFTCQSSKECCGDQDDSATSSAVTTADDDDASITTTTSVPEEDDASATSGTSVTGDADSAESGKADYIMWNWSNSDPQLGEDWESYKNSLISGLKDGEFLEVTGLYRSDETNNTTFENLGLARANEVKNLLSPPLDASRMQLVSRLVDDNVDRENLFSAVAFRNFIKSENIDESIPDRTIIRFPFNSTNKLDDAEVEAYLNDVAERVKSSGERVSLTGHTDNVGSNASNYRLGEWRCDVIRDYLLSKGVSASKIMTESKGEASPMASNNTSSGRAQNRRVELQIIK